MTLLIRQISLFQHSFKEYYPSIANLTGYPNDMRTPNKVLLYYLLNVSSAFCLSAAHNALFYALDMRTVALHFMHHSVTFILLSLSYWVNTQLPRKSLSFHNFKAPVLTQVFIVYLSNIVHSQQRPGGLYLIRVFDFLTMAAVIAYNNVDDFKKEWPSYRTLLPIAFGASLSWMEFGIIEYDFISCILSPILAIIQGLQILQLKKYCKLVADDNPQLFILHFTGLTAAILFFPALYSWKSSRLPLDASWESIDYVLIGMSIIFMANFKYSELWLQLHLDARNFMVLENTKYWAASIAQWFIQNMAHASIISFVGKILFVGFMVKYWREYTILSK